MERPKETVIIVHGTWAAPEPEKRKWYQPTDESPSGELFTVKLDAALRQRGSPARCWAHCRDLDAFFQWSGENTWIARARAASALADYVTHLQIQGWRCHIVAHSHGGNVVVDALSRIAEVGQSDGLTSRVVTLGTPFINVSASISARQREAQSFGAYVSKLIPLFIFLYFYCFAWFYITWGEHDDFLAASIVALLIAIVLRR